MRSVLTRSGKRKSGPTKKGVAARITRREVLRYAAVAGSATVGLAACRKARKPEASGKPGKALSAEETAICGAACERILPEDQDPGAVQLGVVDYIDRRLSRSGRRALQQRARFRRGLTLLADWSRTHHGGEFISLDPSKQDIAIASLAAEGGDEGYAFVRQLVILTVEGAFCDPHYGGNKNRGGWRLVGFDAPCPNPRCD